jgi:serine/threonine protein kinase
MLLVQQELTWGRRLDMLRDVAAGMVFLHSRRPAVIHGDLRSPNLLLDLTFDGARYVACGCHVGI